MEIATALHSRLLPKLKLLYGRRAESCFRDILRRVVAELPHLAWRWSSTASLRRPGYGAWGTLASPCSETEEARSRKREHLGAPGRPLWDQRDVVLITYADQVRGDEETPLRALGRFLAEAELDRLISTIHLLPCFPYSSDDGFSVIDYRRIDPALGDWGDVAELGKKHSLMLDLVLNHVSRESRWFEDYRAGREPWTRFFIEVDPKADVSSVTRPRSSPLLTPVETSRGGRHVWTTFSDDQIDLNYAEPDVLVEMIDVLLVYLCRGARIIRLDAIAYLWKRLGTSCIHLPEVHTVVKIFRDLVDVLAPGAILLTETNVPHEQNVSYFGDGDEAHMVYQFSLAPLLLDALLTGDARYLAEWLSRLEPPRPGTTTFNFTASHDGIGVRPLEGILPPERFERLLAAVGARGGAVSMRRNTDGTESPYELNISYFSALDEPGAADGATIQIRRFLASQAIMLSLRGIPGIYFHSLVATPNDRAGWQRIGQARSINRRKYTAAELRAILAQPGAVPARVLAAYRRMLAARVAQGAFHPEADQELLPVDSPSLVALLRTSLDGRQRILVLANLGGAPQTIDLPRQFGLRPVEDLLAEPDHAPTGSRPRMLPYQVSWFVVEA